MDPEEDADSVQCLCSVPPSGAVRPPSPSLYARNHSQRSAELFYQHTKTYSPPSPAPGKKKKKKTSGPDFRCELLLIVAGDPHMSEHQEGFSAGRQQMGVHRGLMFYFLFFNHSTRYLTGLNAPRAAGGLARGGGGGACYRPRLSAQCCLPALVLCQVRGGGGETITHCLPSAFSSLPCSDTEEVCLLPPKQPGPPNARPRPARAIFTGLRWGHLITVPTQSACGGSRLKHDSRSRSNPRKEGNKLKWQIDGHLLAYFIYLFFAVAEVSPMGLITSK